jgi:hypothetical protein
MVPQDASAFGDHRAEGQQERQNQHELDHGGAALVGTKAAANLTGMAAYGHDFSPAHR